MVRAAAKVNAAIDAKSPAPRVTKTHAVAWIIPTSGRSRMRNNACRPAFPAMACAIGGDHEQ